MAQSISLNKKELLASLEVDIKSVTGAEDFSMEQMSMAKSILKLADINQEREYQLCRSIAEWLLEKVTEPEEIDLEN